jgi:hypothetical protein
MSLRLRPIRKLNRSAPTLDTGPTGFYASSSFGLRLTSCLGHRPASQMTRICSLHFRETLTTATDNRSLETLLKERNPLTRHVVAGVTIKDVHRPRVTSVAPWIKSSVGSLRGPRSRFPFPLRMLGLTETDLETGEVGTTQLWYCSTKFGQPLKVGRVAPVWLRDRS